MKKTSLLVLTIVVFCLVLFACEQPYSPKISVIYLAPGESATFTAYIADREHELVWYLDGEVVAEGQSDFVFVAEDIGDETLVSHTLQAKEEGARPTPVLDQFTLLYLFRPTPVDVKWEIRIVPGE